MQVFETSAFQEDIDAIDLHVFGTIDQETWQSDPIEFEGKKYIKFKPILNEWLNGRQTTEIEILVEENA
tara:strand:- start:965 stop:1171 length:207 start_codon:yes stop_codon:yes gene_type:complete